MDAQAVFVQIDFPSRREDIGPLPDLLRLGTAAHRRRGWFPILGCAVLLGDLFGLNLAPRSPLAGASSG